MHLDMPAQPVPAVSAVSPSPVLTPLEAVVSAAPIRRPDLNGVGGWLLFFCIALTVLWPIWILGNYAVQYAMYKRSLISVRPLVVLGWVKLALGMAVGIVLWVRNSSAMSWLRIYYGLSTILFLFSTYSWVLIIIRYPGAGMMLSLLYAYLPSTAFFLAGVLYFSFSQRVRATYGGNLVADLRVSSDVL